MVTFIYLVKFCFLVQFPKMICLRDFERYAETHLDKKSWEFYRSGAEIEATLRYNIEAFKRYILVPRMLRNKESCDLSVTILGRRVSIPFGLAPVSLQKLAHPEGEMAAARAAAASGAIFTLSSLSNTALEDVASAAPGAPHWMQVYVLKERDMTKRMIHDAEANGYSAIVLTVDAPLPGLRLKSMRLGVPHSPHISFPNVNRIATSLPVRDLPSFRSMICRTLTWDDVTWICNFTHLPVVLKGILTGEDAKLAVHYGAAAVWVSNHGGRQLDGVNAAIDVLPEVLAAVDGKCEVYVDGGIRWGTDILKALALGARAVFIGRPLIWGLVHSGEEGVKKVLEILRNELDLAMRLAGCNSIGDIKSTLVTKEHSSSSKL